MSIIKRSYRPIYFIFVLLLGIAIGNKIVSLRGQPLARSEIYMLAMTVLVLIVLMFRERFFEIHAIKNLEQMRQSSDESWTKLTEWIIGNLSPIIVSLPSNNEVLRQASDIIKKAISEPDSKDRRIVYVGSGDMYKDPLPVSEGDEANTAINEYVSTMALVTRDETNVTRYISLLDDNEYLRRADRTRAAYKKWIKKQILLVDQNGNYSFFGAAMISARLTRLVRAESFEYRSNEQRHCPSEKARESQSCTQWRIGSV